MSKLRANSSPELRPCLTMNPERAQKPEDHPNFEANVKLLLKHNEACNTDDRKIQRVAGMMTILDDVKARIQRSQSFGRKREAELRRCNTDLRRSNIDLRHNNIPRDRKCLQEPIPDDKINFRKELSASMAARKSLEVMCSSLGKEKEIMAVELARKVQELNGMEELIGDLKAQNEMLLTKVQTCASEHKEKKCSVGGETSQGNAALQERNKELSEQLLRSLDGYRSLKRKLKEAQEETTIIRATMEEMRDGVAAGLGRIRVLQQQMATENEPVNIEEDISVLTHLFEGFEMKVSKHGHKKSESVKPKGEINASKPRVLL